MAAIFLSYRRTDSPQACRVYDWLTRRFGNDAVFMDVADIPFAIRFTDYIRQEISESSILIALIGDGWQERLARREDPVLMEIETAVANNITVLPVLIGNTPMPSAEALPLSIASIAYQNASTVGVSRDFDTHMQALLPKIESILGALATRSVVASDIKVVSRACMGVIKFLEEQYKKDAAAPHKMKQQDPRLGEPHAAVDMSVLFLDRFTSAEIKHPRAPYVTFSLHRVAWLADSLELHFILSFWKDIDYVVMGWVMQQLEMTPVIPDYIFTASGQPEPEWVLKIRRSDEDARQIWRMITGEPLKVSLAYIATVSLKPAEAGAP